MTARQIRFCFFDLDNTLENNDNDVTWKIFCVKHGLAPESDLGEAERYFRDYESGKLDLQTFFRFQFREFIGRTPEEMAPFTRQHFEEYARPKIYADARREVEKMLALGIPVGLLSSTCSAITAPSAAAFGIPLVLGTQLEVRDNRYTGNVTGTYALGEGKVVQAREFAAAHGFTLADLAYYGDSTNDVPLLKLAGFPHAVNPSPALRQVAEANGWPVLTWR